MPCGRRRRIRPTRSCSRTATSSSRASTPRAASTSSRRRAGSSGRTTRLRVPGALDRPSLAVRWPNGMIAATDDWHHRIVVIDPRTKRIVWSYGHLDVPGTAAGYLDKPDGLDLLPAAVAGVAPAAAPSARDRRCRRCTSPGSGRLPAPLARASAVALPSGRLVVAGGLVGGSSTDQVLAGPPQALRRVGPPAGARPRCGRSARRRRGRRVRRRAGGLGGHRRADRSVERRERA